MICGGSYPRSTFAPHQINSGFKPLQYPDLQLVLKKNHLFAIESLAPRPVEASDADAFIAELVAELAAENQVMKPTKRNRKSRAERRAVRLANPLPEKIKKVKKEPRPQPTAEQNREIRRAKNQRKAQRKRRLREAAEDVQGSNTKQLSLPKFSTASNKLPLTFNRMNDEVRPEFDLEAAPAYLAKQPPLYEQTPDIGHQQLKIILPYIPVLPNEAPALSFDNREMMPTIVPTPFTFDYASQLRERRPSFVYGGTDWEPKTNVRSSALLDNYEVHSLADSDSTLTMEERHKVC